MSIELKFSFVIHMAFIATAMEKDLIMNMPM